MSGYAAEVVQDTRTDRREECTNETNRINPKERPSRSGWIIKYGSSAALCGLVLEYVVDGMSSTRRIS